MTPKQQKAEALALRLADMITSVPSSERMPLFAVLNKHGLYSSYISQRGFRYAHFYEFMIAGNCGVFANCLNELMVVREEIFAKNNQS